MYFQQSSNTRISKKMVQHLIFWIKEKYGIQLDLDNLRDHQLELLANKNKQTISEVSELLEFCNEVSKNTYTSENTLIKLYEKTYAFKHQNT